MGQQVGAGSRCELTGAKRWLLVRGKGRGWLGSFLDCNLLLASSLRLYKPISDALFYLCILVAAWRVAHSTIVAGIIPVSVLVVGELVCNGLSLVKFRVLPATHTISAKFYGLCLFIACLCVIAYGVGPWILWALAGVSILANAEVVALLLLAKEAPVDVLSIFHFRRKQANPQGGANGRQPFSSETNRTSATAASRRSP